jgi:hypothetical protein
MAGREGKFGNAGHADERNLSTPGPGGSPRIENAQVSEEVLSNILFTLKSMACIAYWRLTYTSAIQLQNKKIAKYQETR